MLDDVIKMVLVILEWFVFGWWESFWEGFLVFGVLEVVKIYFDSFRLLFCDVFVKLIVERVE